MSGFLRNGCALGVLVVFLAGSPLVRAELITPDSIPSPPSVSAATDGAAVGSGGWVTDQYVSKGLNFPYRMTGVDTGLTEAIVQVNGIKVWTGANSVDGGLLGGVSFSSGVKAELVVPGTQTPDTTNFLRLQLLASGGQGVASGLVQVYDAQGNPLLVQKTSITENATGTWVTLSVPGIQSFQVTASSEHPSGSCHDMPFSWGVAAVEFHPAPEPTSLALATFGLVGLIVSTRGRRFRVRRKMPGCGGTAGQGR